MTADPISTRAADPADGAATRVGPSVRRRLLVSAAVALATWAVFSWPLSAHVATGIASSGSNIEKGHVRNMIAGDHLQLLYRFWLFQDFLLGDAPLFSNLYEFSLSDAPREWPPRAYYLPFSLLYALVAPWAGRAMGWNLTGLVSLWLAYLFAWRLARRYAGSEAVAGFAALFAIVPAFVWRNVLGGSPTGFALVFVPMMAWGLDRAAREDDWRGSLVASLAMLFAALSDRHAFFFGALSAPLWVFAAWLDRERFAWRSGRAYVRTAVALAPVVPGYAFAFALLKLTTRHVEESAMADGRSLQEVRIFCHHADGFFAPVNMFSAELHVGFAALAAVLLGIAAMAWLACRGRPPVRRLAVLAFLLLAAIGVGALALGVNGPSNGKPFLLAREYVPKYDLIRQPAKIFCLAPTLLAVTVALAFGQIATALAGARRPALARAAWAPALLLALVGFVEHRRWINPTVCLLARSQPAYEAIAHHAAASGLTPRLLAIPLWPGESHWSSLYQHYVSLYRLRMVNGYTPAVPATYAGEIFRPFASVNGGLLDDGQVAELLRRNVHYVVFHENAFPRKVNALPGTETLRRLLVHPRLDLLARHHSVWSFAIRETPRTVTNAPAGWTTFSCARDWEAEGARLSGGARDLSAADASNGGLATLPAPGAELRTKATDLRHETGLRFLARVRGSGECRAESRLDGQPHAATNWGVATPSAWTWLAAPVPAFEGWHDLNLSLSVTRGAVDVDTVLLVAGDWDPALGGATGGRVVLPAPVFFHYGYTDFTHGEVTLLKDEIASYESWYGPRLPLDPGEYVFSLDYRSPARSGTRLGRLTLDKHGPVDSVRVIAGQPAELWFVQEDNLPVNFYLHFGWTGDVVIRSATLRRVRAGERSTRVAAAL
jgi:hypothetical protein